MLVCYGVADTRTGAPVTVESRFAVGSLTKSMVATVVARLAEDGGLSLDDPVVAIGLGHAANGLELQAFCKHLTSAARSPCSA